MANWSDPQRTGHGAAAASVGRQDVAYDAGLRSYMLSIYNYMASAILLTGIVALGFFELGYAKAMMGTPVMWVVILAPLAIVFAMSFGANRFSAGALQAMFWGFAVLMGLSMSTLFLRYTEGSIALTFFATAAAFAGLSLYGYTTKRDLTGMGTFLVMGLIGLIVASVINMFAQSSTLFWVISFAGVLIFAGLTAYDTQKIKSMYFHVRGSDFMGKSVILAALTLYLDFINMFQFLLSFLGSRD